MKKQVLNNNIKTQKKRKKVFAITAIIALFIVAFISYIIFPSNMIIGLSLGIIAIFAIPLIMGLLGAKPSNNVDNTPANFNLISPADPLYRI